MSAQGWQKGRPVRHAKAIGRLGGLAIGLGIGAAASAIGTASADPLPPFDPNDFAISIDGFTFQTGTATATSGMGDFAIADGANSFAKAVGGFGDFASADGAHAVAFIGEPTASATSDNFDFASVVGNGSDASVRFGSFDFASVIGNGSGAAAGFGELNTPANFANFDSAFVLGDNSAVAADLGSNNLAFVFDPVGSLGSEAFAQGVDGGLPGNFDLAGVFGDGLLQNSIGDLVAHIAQLF
jgi:hypothetical protein